MQDTIKTLEDQIKTDIDSVKTKRLMLKALRKEEAKNTPFSATGLGKAYLGTLRALTSPFAKMNQSVDLHLEQPFVVQSQKLQTRASKILLKAKDYSQEKNSKKATRHALRLASMVMELEDFCERHELFAQHHEDAIEKMRVQVERLRPVKDEKKLQSLKDQLEVGLSAQPA